MGKNERLVFAALKDSGQPMTAYALLDVLKKDGLRAPVQVYRALDKLITTGQVHRLESLNAFVACNHSHCADSSEAAFAICDSCGTVTEFADPELGARLTSWADKTGFKPAHSTLELRGTCAKCSE